MVLLDFSMAPMGKGESVAPYVARCLEIVAASGLDYRLHAMGTTLEGEWDQVLVALHARRSYQSIRGFHRDYADRPLVVALTGTDLYHDLSAGLRHRHLLLQYSFESD